jgi:hypothetical protein
METDADPSLSRPSSGGVIRFQARLTNLITWVGPTWACLCGVVASKGFTWQGEDWARLVLLILLVDGGWGTLWAALGNTDWAAALRRWRNWRAAQQGPSLPYTLPGSPGDRVSRWLGQLRGWWRDVLWPGCGPALSAIAIAVPVTALLAALLGPQLLLLSLGTLAVMQLGVAWVSGRGAVTPEWDAPIAVLLPWLAGHVAFAPLTPTSAGTALVVALAWAAAWRVGSPWGRLGLVGSHLLLATLLVGLFHPLRAGALFLLLIPQLALFPWMRQGQPASWYTRHTRPWLMAAMLVAAWSL